MTYLFYPIFRNRNWLGKFKENLKNCSITLFLSNYHYRLKNLHFFQALSLLIYLNSLQFSKSLVPACHACHTILIVLTLRNFNGLSCPKETSAQIVLSARFMEHLITSKFYEVTAILPSWRGRRCQI